MYAADPTSGLNVSFTHAMYNDDPPNASTASSGYAHAKGFLAANQTNGFWVVHSVPNWPYSLTVGYLPFPTVSQGKFAQSFICLSMNASTTNLVGISLLKMRPKYYSQSVPPSLLPLFPDINAALKSTGVITTAPFAISVPLYSAGIASPPRLFTSFAKSVKFGQDIWNVKTPSVHLSSRIAPTLAFHLRFTPLPHTHPLRIS
jgi:deoxyribonuclease-2